MPKETLTPSQRLEAYRWAKLRFKKHREGPYLCNVLFAHLGGDMTTLGWIRKRNEFIKNNFPELIKHKPKVKLNGLMSGWFEYEDSKSRHKVLDKCISEVQKLIEVKQ